MKNRLAIFSFAVVLLFVCQTGISQCAGDNVNFNEDDFNLLTIKADEANPNPPDVTSNTIDIWDLSTASGGTDGIADVEITLSAGLFNPNANGTCDDGEFFVSAAIGGGPLPMPGPSGSSDFGGSANDDCVCESGYSCFTYSFLNGFSSTAAALNAAVTSSNGSTEGHEAMVGWVNMGMDATGAPLTLPTVNLAAMSTFCTIDYNGGVSVSQQIGATGAGTFAVDENTGITNDCATSGQNGEDTDSGDNPNDNTNAQAENPDWGLNPTDIITEFTVCWIFTNAPGTDCDGDGDVGVGTNPSGSIGNITVCPPPPPCDFIADCSITEECGEFTIEVTITGTAGQDAGGATPVAGDFEVSTDGGTSWTAFTPNTTMFPADGSTQYIIRVSDDDDAMCMTEVCTLTAPTGTSPNVPTFVPNNPTTGNN